MNKEKQEEWQKSRMRMREERKATALFPRVCAGERTALSLAITLLESQQKEDRKEAQDLLQMCLPFSGKSIRIGITGVPGVGKSSFIEQFGKLILKEGKKIAVLAIDPSSEKSGGSILGDKTRMQDLSMCEDAFIRPSAAGNTLGGVARKTREAILLCEAAGYDFILIETVGVGQSEIMVHSMVDFFLLLLLSGAGDELQGIKRGIMEMADGLMVTKADGENILRAKLAAREVKNAIHLFPANDNNWIPEVKTGSAINNEGLDEIYKMILRFELQTKLNGSFDSKRKHQEKYWMQETLKDLLEFALRKSESLHAFIQQKETEVLEGKTTAFSAAEEIFNAFLKENKA